MQTWWSHSGHVGEGKRTFTSFSQGTRTKKMEESGRKGRRKKIEPLIARCSRYFESVVLLSIIFLVIAAHGIRHPFPRRDQRFCCEKKRRTPPRLPFSLWTSIIDHLASFASEKVGIVFEIRDRKLRTRV